jgi:hypothetical protein
MKKATKVAVFGVFTRADSAALNFAEELLALGVGDRTTAYPLAIEWASEKFTIKMVEGQRGLGLDQKHKSYNTAKSAYRRVLDLCFPASDTWAAEGKRQKAVDPIAKLLTSYAKLTGPQKRAFKAKLAQL